MVKSAHKHVVQACSHKGHWKSFWSEHDATVNDFQWLIMEQVQSWQSLQYLPQSDLHLKACQWCTNTEVDTMAKGQMTVRVTLDIKLLRVGKLAFIEVV